MFKIKVMILVVLVVLLSSSVFGGAKLMRFPDIYKDKVVFVSGEDIWIASVDGGKAKRLTINDGSERFPKFSPDGKLIAFTGQYDGNIDVYVMNTDGGNIRRVTYHSGGDQVVGWHPTKNKIIFQSGRNSFSRYIQLFLISPDGTGVEPLIMHEAVYGSFSADGSKIAYNRIAREGRTWKRYQGGLAQDIFMFDFKLKKDYKLTTFKGTDRTPMWIGEKIYFTSDKDQFLNIYSYDPKTKELKQLTFHKDYDVRRPSDGLDCIVYEHGGDLWKFDIKTGKYKNLNIKVAADSPETRPYLKKVNRYLTNYSLSPSGKRSLIVARGEVFTVPAKYGPVRNLTNDSGSREKDAVWSPDGKKIAYLSDKAGEYDIYIADPKGVRKAKKITSFKKGYRHTLKWSPDSKKIGFTDETLTLYYIDIANSKITKVDKAEYENVDVSMDVKPIFDYSWSHDSKYLTYSKMNSELVQQVYIYSLTNKLTRNVSYGLFNDFNPVFSKDGKYLFFISNRRFNPTLCDFEWEMVYKNVAGIYVMTLQENTPSFLKFRNDEEGKKPKADKKDSKKDVKKALVINFKGIKERVEALPLTNGNYRSLSVSKDSLYYLNADKGDFNRFEFRARGPMDLYSYSFKKRKATKLTSSIRSYKLSSDNSHLIYRIGRNLFTAKAAGSKIKGKKVSLNNLKMNFHPKKEWKQIFNEAWRLERDYYYDPNMKGVNWDQMKKRYGKLVERATCRQDIRFIIGELIGELNTSHTYVFGGDSKRRGTRVNIGLLGVDWAMDSTSKKYKFKKIYNVPDWSRGVKPPLGKPGLNISEGDYLLKINGKSVSTTKNIYSYFQDLAGKQITLTVAKTPDVAAGRDVVVKPSFSERTLRYLDWVEGNRKKVAKRSNGKIGYLHLPDTYLRSAVEFPKYFYSQMAKKGMIVDGRYNGGGLDPDIFLQRLDKKNHTYWTRRHSAHQKSPNTTMNSHFVCLTNKQAGSGGDELPHVFRWRKMGPIIGTRTWGGLVGVSMFISMIDGGGLTAPDYRIYDDKGEWVIENIGVEPDIKVDLDPVEVSKGIDAQLDKGIEYLMDKIKKDPKKWPKHKKYIIEKFNK